MIKCLLQTLKIKVMASALLLLIGLWQSPVAIADQPKGALLATFANDMHVVLFAAEQEELSESQLSNIRGTGVNVAMPDPQIDLSVILWDECDVKKGTRYTSGYDNSVVTVEVYLGGTLK
ncbi:hypothetical protein Q4488_16660 [Amphritea sp. 1_MG-2023]|uniref:hypothetical protein n=1 Tax=Amphritea sp. 1_MG-2023 TaxID=3062670 RepID=UPI0026E22294|nr:hypothetical protein [Amphritea sp. 1_MG-2023]MDO6565014.1 hypothetical protein [Amphritea sp. 1_MG-2023]